ncbi:hypothetical protein L218DRAFT_1080973 [Marasmius fiardii PR-910]|nr:hypothetical protein L218DRAFT_1080973 [Marasmius fiardii PR-910]
MAGTECILANPSISGIGVRVAVYSQTFLSFAPAFLFTYDGKLDLQEERSLLAIYIPLLISSMALLVTTSIQQSTTGLGNHHILLVLNFTWMMNASALVICVVPTLKWLGRSGSGGSEATQPWTLTQESKDPKVTRWLSKVIWRPRRTRQLLGVVLVSVHLTGMGILGIWHWTVLRISGLNPSGSLPPSECFEKINTTYLFMNFPITNPTIRTLSLIFYSFMVIPIINIEISVMLVYAISWLIIFPTRTAFRRLPPSGRTWLYSLFAVLIHPRDSNGILEPRLKCIVPVVFPLMIAVHTVIDTELMLKKNTPLIGPGESQWTFGQVLALMLVILPLIQVLTMFAKGTPLGRRLWRWATNGHTSAGRKNRDFHWLVRRILAPSEPWPNLYEEILKDLHTARSAVHDLGNELVMLTDIQGNASRLSLPCVTASAIFTLRSLLFVADQTLVITNETFKPPEHPPLVNDPTIRRPVSFPSSLEVQTNYSSGHQGGSEKSPDKELDDLNERQKSTEARIKNTLDKLQHALTEARDKISIAQCVRFPGIEDVSRYHAVASHLKHLLASLDTMLTISDNLEVSGACFLRAHSYRPLKPPSYHVCHFDHGGAVGQMKANLVYDFGGTLKEEQVQGSDGNVGFNSVKKYDHESQTSSSSNE